MQRQDGKPPTFWSPWIESPMWHDDNSSVPPQGHFVHHNKQQDRRGLLIIWIVNLEDFTYWCTLKDIIIKVDDYLSANTVDICTLLLVAYWWNHCPYEILDQSCVIFCSEVAWALESNSTLSMVNEEDVMRKTPVDYAHEGQTPR